MVVNKFLGYLKTYEESLLGDMRKELIGKKVVVAKDSNKSEVIRRYSEYQAMFIELNTIKNFFNNIDKEDQALFTDFIKLCDLLEHLPLNSREKAQLVIEAYRKNVNSGILSVTEFDNFFIIDANKLVTVDFKTISTEQVFKMYKEGTILDFIYLDEALQDEETKAQIDELLERKDEYCMDSMKIYDNTVRMNELLFKKDSRQTDDEIKVIEGILRHDRVSESVINDVVNYIVYKRKKLVAREERERKEKEVVIRPVQEVKRSSNLVTDKEYKQLKKEIREYYDLYHMELVKDVDYNTMIDLVSKMLKIGVHKDEIKKFISIVKDTLTYSENSITRFVSEFDRLNYYYDEYDLENILDYINEIFICSNEDYEFWKEEVRAELSRLLKQIEHKYDYELDVAKKRLSI